MDSSTLFRAGETLTGQATYTPRLVLWDLNGALGGTSAGGSLYRDGGQSAGVGAVVSSWAGGQEVHRAAPVARSRFAEELEDESEGLGGEGEQEEEPAAAGAGGGVLAAAAAQLDSGSGDGGGGGGVRFFTDFLKAHLHPRSVHQLGGAWHGLTPFGGWGDGGEHWRSEEQREEGMERIRWAGYGERHGVLEKGEGRQGASRVEGSTGHRQAGGAKPGRWGNLVGMPQLLAGWLAGRQLQAASFRLVTEQGPACPLAKGGRWGAAAACPLQLYCLLHGWLPPCCGSLIFHMPASTPQTCISASLPLLQVLCRRV